MQRAFRSMTAKVAIVGVVGLTLLGGLAYAGVLPESLRSSPEEFLASLGLDPDDPEGENGDEENGFDPAPLREGSEASENASETAISVLTVIQAWHDGEFESGCEFGQAVAAAARGDGENGGENGAENGEEDAFNPCENGGENGEEASAAGKAKGEEMSAAGRARGEEASAAGKAKGEAAAAAGKAKGEGASGGAGSGGGPPAGAGPPSGTPGGP